MRIALLLVAGLWLCPSLAHAQARVDCGTCVAAADCGGRHDECVAECRARLFTIDPKRAACIADCGKKIGQCAQAADASCREQKACP